MSINVMIADDHPIVRDGLRMSIERSRQEIIIIAEAADGLEVLELIKTTSADIFILDITMPNMNGIDTAKELRKTLPTAKIIMLSLHDTQAMVETALAAGALGYLTKEMASRNVVDAITAVYAGHYYLCPMVAHYVVDAALRNIDNTLGSNKNANLLTAQETKVLQLIAEGKCTKEVARMLQLSTNTIHVHRKRIMAKLDIHKQADLIRYAIKAGIAKL